MSRLSVEQWRRQVFRSPKISDPVRVYLLYLADNMRADRKVSLPRAKVAKALGKSERRISERTSAAHAAGFLSTVSAGYRGHVPVYEGIVPAAERETPTSALSGAETRTLPRRKRVTHGGPTTTRADLTATGADRNVGNDEKAIGHSARSDLTPCEWHRWESCPPDCANHHHREVSA